MSLLQSAKNLSMSQPNPYYADASTIRNSWNFDLSKDFFHFEDLQTNFMILCSFEFLVADAIKIVESYSLQISENSVEILNSIGRNISTIHDKYQNYQNAEQLLKYTEYWGTIQEEFKSCQDQENKESGLTKVFGLINERFCKVIKTIDHLLKNRIEFGLYNDQSIRFIQVLFDNIQTELEKAQTLGNNFRHIITMVIPDLFQETPQPQEEELNQSLRDFINVFFETEAGEEEEEEAEDGE